MSFKSPGPRESSGYTSLRPLANLFTLASAADQLVKQARVKRVSFYLAVRHFYNHQLKRIILFKLRSPHSAGRVKKEDNIFDKGHQKTGESIVFPGLS